MFTEGIYHQYFLEIHRKEKEMIVLLRRILDHVADDYMSKAIAWHMKREIRLAVLVRKLIRPGGSFGSQLGEKPGPPAGSLDSLAKVIS